MTDLTLRCECGELEGTLKHVSPQSGNHMVCYCNDCQGFAKHVGNEEKWLDEWGGTDVFQLAPADVVIDKGAEQLRCVRMTPGGIYRFYTACCHAPIANTISRKHPFVGIPTAVIHGAKKEEALGPVKCYVMGSFAKGTPPTKPHPKFSMKSLVAVIGFMLKNKIKGRNVPTPFFKDDGKSISPPDQSINRD
ncbi:hypothetical protein GCE9029_03499 [Grimontia celer]|uniref:CENP-V/GFA domain-containing protein n=1 Tax=Grimontia celer TaxID=1796497 RepID=A0A128F7Y9_9GAMM|nr:DUF6151 family protein [Grimontia celer]CZF82882.1 hypothetical protein GCE9029_03499 [Grimontia celer]